MKNKKKFFKFFSKFKKRIKKIFHVRLGLLGRRWCTSSTPSRSARRLRAALVGTVGNGQGHVGRCCLPLACPARFWALAGKATALDQAVQLLLPNLKGVRLALDRSVSAAFEKLEKYF